MPRKLQRRVATARPQTTAVAATPGSGSAADGERRPLFGGQRATQHRIADFTSQLAVLLDAGLPVTRSLRILEGQLQPGALKRALGDIVEDVESGTALSEAMSKHERIFDRLYTNMVRAGEAGGIQEEILLRLASFMERSEQIRSRVKGALVYPVAVILVALGVLVLVFVFVIPGFEQIFLKQFGSLDQLPTLTRYLINTGRHLQGLWWSYVLGAGLIYALHRVLVARVPKYRSFRDKLLLRLPVFGTLASKAAVGRFSRTFGTLVQSGVPHLEALEIIEGSSPNVHMQSAVRGVHASIREGAGIAVPMGESGMFDDIVVNMVEVGEQTGELDAMLIRVANRYDTEVDRAVETTFRIIEPLLLVALAVVVGIIVYALFAPLLTLMESL